MGSTIRLECPRCRRTVMAAREKFDPPRAVMAEIQCPECVGGDFDHTTYRDAKGDEVLEDPASRDGGAAKGNNGGGSRE